MVVASDEYNYGRKEKKVKGYGDDKHDYKKTRTIFDKFITQILYKARIYKIITFKQQIINSLW